MFEMLCAVITLAVQDTDITPEAAEAVGNAAEAAAPVAEEATLSGGMIFGIFIAGIVLAFVLGAFLAKSMKVSQWGLRFGVCLAALAIGVMPFVVRMINGETLGEGIRLGIDLAGGTNMVFQVKPDEGKELTDEIMDNMVGAIGKRINPTGTSEITVRQVGRDRIEVIVPGEDPQTVNDIKRRITKLGSLEFFITVDERYDDPTMIRDARLLPNNQTRLIRTVQDADGKDIEEVYAMWLPAFEKGENREPQLLELNNTVKRNVEKTRTVDGRTERYTTEEYLVLVDPVEQQVSGQYLKRAGSAIDPETGTQMVTFSFDTRGAFLFSRLTSRFQPKQGVDRRHLAIVLDRMLYSAPSINAVISDRGQITGDFTVEEVRELTSVLNAGALDVPINPKPLSEATVDPTLGEDVRKKGVTAIFVAGAVVVVFMLLYYQFAGIVAIICLVLNLVLVLTIMMAINATFTLPGLAGLVLTIGMAVDANVLIFERIREETNRGASLRMAIQNGFGKAFSTIIDANVTTLITAIVLFMIGTDQVKGFAVSLFIGIVVSMFTALYVGRVIFDVAEKKGWIRNLKMFSFVGDTHWDFLGKRFICATLSVALIVGGLSAFAARENNYDIDFTGGTMVTFQLTEPAETSAVEAVLGEKFEKNFTVERLTLAGDDTTGGSRHFRLRSIESDTAENAGEEKSAEERVRDKVYEAFQGNDSMKLLMVSMTYGDITDFKIAEDDKSAEALLNARFDSGHQATLEFSTEVAVGTIRDMLARAIGGITAGDAAKYSEPEMLFGIKGEAGSGLEAQGQDVQKFSKVAVRTTPDVSSEDLATALSNIQSDLDSRPLFDEVNTFASAVASEMKTSAIMAIVISLLAIVAYIWFRFQKITFGLAAVVALVHDVLIVLGAMALTSYLAGTPVGDLLLLNDFRINLPMVAAFLTIVGYSLNDTIVVFDRIREVRGKNPNLTDEIVNTSLNQTLSRTLLTSLTTFLVVIILYVIGGEGIHGFAFCLTLGVIVGTYSSIYVASPVLVWLMNRDQKKTMAAIT
ncbi:MAG: protein translocase subunit SecD [Planctomycetaceae bacterium]